MQNNFVQVVFLATPLGQFTVNVLHHHDRTVNDDSEIDGADGKQISRQVLCVQQNEAEEQRQWNGQGNDNRRAEANQEEEQHNEHEDHPADQIVFYRTRSQIDQVAAVVKRTNFHVLGQDQFVQL